MIVPTTVFRFLSRLDGATPWPQALDQANAEQPSSIDRRLVDQLYRAGVIVAADR
ncbi:MAG: hypothetical protein JW797_20415 [Bradymonadales bacterium]|nr:hypothetical protein [Bradymonadales bacterium]